MDLMLVRRGRASPSRPLAAQRFGRAQYAGRMPRAPIRPIGAHTPVVGGLATASLKYAAAVGAEAMQIIVTTPRGWAASPGDDEQTGALRDHVAATGFAFFIHAPYLINVGSPDPVLRDRSRELLAHCLRRGGAIGARGVVVHAGSAVAADRDSGLCRVGETLLPLLDTLPEDGHDGPDLLIEPMAGQGTVLCAAIRDVGPYFDPLDWHPRAALPGYLPPVRRRARPDRGTRRRDCACRTRRCGAGPAQAHSRQRRQGRLRVTEGPAPEHRLGQAWHHAVLGAASSSGNPRNPAPG